MSEARQCLSCGRGVELTKDSKDALLQAVRNLPWDGWQDPVALSKFEVSALALWEETSFDLDEMMEHLQGLYSAARRG